MKLINKGIVVLTALTLYLQPAYSKGNIELRADRNSFVSDMKMSDTIGNRVWYFARHLQTTDYDWNTSGFTLIDVNYKISGGLDVVVENQFSEAGVDVKLGVLVGTNLGEINLSCGALFDLDRKKHELNIFANYGKNKFKANSEVYTSLRNDGGIKAVNGRVNLGYRISDNVTSGIFGQGILNLEGENSFDSKAGVFFKIGL
jgi:hypothetical protein